MYTYYYMYVALLPPFFLNLEVRLKGAFTWNIKFTRQYIYIATSHVHVCQQ